MATPYEVLIAVPGDRSWCIEQKSDITRRLRETTFDALALPAVTVEGDPAELLFRWTDLTFDSGWTALSVAHVAGFEVMPELKRVPGFRAEVQAQDP